MSNAHDFEHSADDIDVPWFHSSSSEVRYNNIAALNRFISFVMAGAGVALPFASTEGTVRVCIQG